MIQQYSKNDNIAFARQWAARTAKTGEKPGWIDKFERFSKIFEDGASQPFATLRIASKYICLNVEFANAYYEELARQNPDGKKTVFGAKTGIAPLAEEPLS
jgi:hypothetical protein